MHYTIYTIWEQLLFFFLYGFLGWACSVVFHAFRTGRFVNPGVLYGPISLTSGLVMTIAIVLIADYAVRYLTQFFLTFVVIFIISSMGGVLAERTLGRKLWDYSGGRYFALGGWRGLVRTLILTLGVLLTVHLLHPFFYLPISMLPELAVQIIDAVLLFALLCDLFTLSWALRAIKTRSQFALEVSASLQDLRMTWGSRLVSAVRDRIWKAFPEMADQPTPGTGFGEPKEGRIFAQGVSFYKIFWVFLICALLGDWIETVYVGLQVGYVMSRSSVIYGTFSLVWGLGGALFTIVLQPLRERSDRLVFIGGFLIGGAFEYLCSVFTEIVFGTVFWDYSNMPFNIQGRTNLLFMFFWGVLALVWVKAIYPPLSRTIERIPPVVGTVLTWCLVVFMVLNISLSGMAMGRYLERMDGTAEPSAIGTFLDTQYPDELVETIWPNMRIRS